MFGGLLLGLCIVAFLFVLLRRKADENRVGKDYEEAIESGQGDPDSGQADPNEVQQVTVPRSALKGSTRGGATGEAPAASTFVPHMYGDSLDKEVKPVRRRFGNLRGSKGPRGVSFDEPQAESSTHWSDEWTESLE